MTMFSNQKVHLRDSNMEMLRIISILVIIASHYTASSGVLDLFGLSENTKYNEYLLFACSSWGKVAINCFILISGYYLCTGKLTWQRYIKLLAQVIFYQYAIFILAALIGIVEVTPYNVYRTLFSIPIFINEGFTSSFLAFYLFVPCYNIIIKNLSKKHLGFTILGLLWVFTISSSFFFSKSMNEPFWYMTMYLLGGYIRLYPNFFFDSKKYSIYLLLGGLSATFCSYLFFQKYGETIAFFMGMSKVGTGYWTGDSCRLMALIVGLAGFLVAKNTNKFYNKYVNEMALGCFGVLLIHANFATRNWMWQSVFHVNKFFYESVYIEFLHLCGCTMIIFLIGTGIDYMRRKYIEKPFMNWIYNNSDKIDRFFS